MNLAAQHALPYPLPEGWQNKAARPVRAWVAILWTFVAAVVAALLAKALLGGEIVGGLLWTLVFSAVGLCLGMGYERSGGQRGLPLLVNAVTLSRAQVRPVDSWIHFFREAGPGRWMTAWFALTGGIASGALVWIGFLVFVEGGGTLWLFVALIPLFLAALVVAFTGAIAIILRWRHASFGRRPVGLSLGHGVIHYYLDDADVWPWEQLADVRTGVSAVDPKTGDFQPRLILTPTQDADDLELMEYEIGSGQSHPWLIYTAVRFWFEHPEHRDELSTTFAQRRIKNWRDAMAASGPPIHSPQPGEPA